MPLDMELGLNPGDFVLDGDPASPKKGADPPQNKINFGPCLLWPNGWMDQNGTWHGGRPQPRRLCVRWGASTPPQKGVRAPSTIFGKFLLCPKAGCITMPLGMEVGLSPGDFVFDGDPALLPKKGRSRHANFWPMSIVVIRLDGPRWHLAWSWALVQATLC